MTGGWIVLGLIILYVVVRLYRNRVSNRGITNSSSLRKALVDDNERCMLVDVRTPAEYRAGHIPGAINIPHTKIAKKPPTRSKDSLVVLYCRSGNRSGRARANLRSMGYVKVVNFGGIGKWDGPLIDGASPGELVFEAAE